MSCMKNTRWFPVKMIYVNCIVCWIQYNSFQTKNSISIDQKYYNCRYYFIIFQILFLHDLLKKLEMQILTTKLVFQGEYILPNNKQVSMHSSVVRCNKMFLMIKGYLSLFWWECENLQLKRKEVPICFYRRTCWGERMALNIINLTTSKFMFC